MHEHDPEVAPPAAPAFSPSLAAAGEGAGGWGFVLVLNWNRWRDTLRCLASLDGLDYPSYRVLVIDNGSQDGSVEQLRAARPDVTLLESDGNLGFAGGNNLGIRYALDHGAEYIWVLNNDTVVEPAALRRAIAAMEQEPSLGIVGSTHVTSAEPWQDGEPYATAVHLHGRTEHAFLCTEHLLHDDAPPHRVDTVRTTMLLRARMLREIGLLETRYFHYYEEIDLSLRARASGTRSARASPRAVHRRCTTMCATGSLSGGSCGTTGPAKPCCASLSSHAGS
jgi:GT2 family glycosyltransferase